MAKEAIEKVREAEVQANVIMQEANQNSRDSKKEAEILADEKYKQIIREADREAKEIQEKALQEGEIESKPILEKGLIEAKKLEEITDQDLDSVVNIIIERIVNANGNS